MSLAVLGVDGCRGAWVAARVTSDQGAASPPRVEWRHGRFADLLDPAVTTVGVDIPVGLPDRGERRCDLAARSALGRARSRVFMAPVAASYDAPDHAAANVLLRSLGEKGMSIQTWGLRSAVLEVAACQDGRIHEVHPELAFAELLGAVPVPKKTAAGVGSRLAALARWSGLDVVEALGRAPARVPVDDALDALAAAWTASRVATGIARRWPADATAGEPVIYA